MTAPPEPRPRARPLDPAPGWPDLAAAGILLLALLALFWPMALMRAVPVPNDTWTTDLYNEHVPLRLLLGQALRQGALPYWTPLIYSGYPAAANPGTGTFYPLNWLFAVMPWPAALNLGLLLTYWLAGLFFYAYARAIGAARSGALFGGIAFMLSGFMVSQVRAFSLIHAAMWLPLPLALFEVALRTRRISYILSGAAAWALLILAGSPHIAYIVLLGSAAYLLVRLLQRGRPLTGGGEPLPPRWLLGAGAAAVAAALLAVGIAAIHLLPIAQMSAFSERARGLTFAEAAAVGYYLPDLLTFLYPLASGDLGQATYRGGEAMALFWEDYGYAGLLTVLLALFAAISAVRRWRGVRVFLAVVIAAGLLMVGTHTPLFRLAYYIVPGMDRFRVPSRFVLWVDFGLCVLAALALTDLARRLPPRAARLLAAAAVVLLCFDLWFYQGRQLPMGSASAWSQPPSSADLVRLVAGGRRTYTIAAYVTFRAAYAEARGWRGDLSPYLRQRDFLQPSSNIMVGIPSPAGYAALPPGPSADVWGSQMQHGVIRRLEEPLFRDGVAPGPAMMQLLDAWDVGAVLSLVPLNAPDLVLRAQAGPALLYQNFGALGRVRIVPQARAVSDDEALRLLEDGAVDLTSTLLLADTSAPAQPGAAGAAQIISDHATRLAVETRCAAPAWLLVTDAFYPAWRATVDGAPAAIRRANLCQRAVRVPDGTHTVTFAYDTRPYHAGAVISLGALLVWIIALSLLRRRERLLA